MRRTLELADPRTLDKIARVRARVRAHVWSLIAARPGEGSLNCPTRSPRRTSGSGGCAAFSATTRRRLAGSTPYIRAADTFRRWSRNSSSLQPSDWPPPRPARMTRRSRIQPELRLTSAAHDQRAERPRACQRAVEVVATGGLRWKAGRPGISPTQQAQPAPLP